MDRRDSCLLSLPPLVYGAGVALAMLVGGPPWSELSGIQLTLTVMVGVAAAGVVALGGLVALAHKLPLWGYTWVGATMVLGLLLLQVANEELVEEAGRTLPVVVEGLVAAAVVGGFAAAVGFSARKGAMQATLLSMGVAMLFGLSLLHSVAMPPFNQGRLALLAAPAGLAFAALAYVFARGGLRAQVGSTLGVLALNVAVVWTATLGWTPVLQERGASDPFYPLVGIISLLLLAGPVVGLLLPRTRRAPA